MPAPRKIEIMAPAGSYESLSAAIRAGAGAVYFGVGKLNMRARSSANFEPKDIHRIAEICRRMKVKSYLALNTIVYDEEISEVKSIIKEAASSGVSAVIASDIAVIEEARAAGIEVHMSVQANICNIHAVRFYSKYADVIVLARELSLPQIKSICDTVRNENILGPSGELLRIEIFAHGALCVAVSGRCYMSLGVYDFSANRGACFQNCRRSYRIIDDETGEELLLENKYVMSPKDICTLRFLDTLIDAGISVFKIEGRGRSPDYVYSVTKTYKDAIDAVLAGDFTEDKINQWMKVLSSVFNRGFWEGGYYLGEKMEQWCGIDGSRSEKKKIHIGTVRKYFPKAKAIEIGLCAGALRKGQEIMISGPTTGALIFNVEDIRLERAPVEEAPKGSVVSVSSATKARPNDCVYLLEERKFGQSG
ncbi:MAG: collagenase [Lentisphaerae bacterium GWF2_45_14]|nr:MAG: collagenase [Lentisphaerae bacterium GWF2_45_14]